MHSTERMRKALELNQGNLLIPSYFILVFLDFASYLFIFHTPYFLSNFHPKINPVQIEYLISQICPIERIHDEYRTDRLGVAGTPVYTLH